jgi:hypothetical protein
MEVDHRVKGRCSPPWGNCVMVSGLACLQDRRPDVLHTAGLPCAQGMHTTVRSVRTVEPYSVLKKEENADTYV